MLLSALALAAPCCSAPTGPTRPIPTLTATAADFNQTAWPFSGAYLANGFVGLRVGPRALVRDPWAGATAPASLGNAMPVESTLVGGYLMLDHEVKGAPTPMNQSDGIDTYAPAPFPFETEVLVTPEHGPSFRLSEASPPRPSDWMDQRGFEKLAKNGSEFITVVNQTLAMGVGELTTHLRIAPPTGEWALELEVTQFLSRSMPSLALQRVRARATPPTLRFSLQPLLTTDGLCTAAGCAAYHNTIPMRNHWGYGHPVGVGMRTNMGARLVLAVQSMCNGDDVDTDYQQSQAQPCAHPAATTPEKAGSFPPGTLEMDTFVAIVSDVYHARPSVVSRAILLASGLHSSKE